MKKFILLFTITVSVLTVKPLNATNIIVSGAVSGNWNSDTVKVIGEVIIPDDSVLTINPGVIVEFYGHFKIVVKGSVVAIGTDASLIRFTVNDTTGFSDTTTTSGGWHGFIYDHLALSADSSKFSFCVFEFGKAVDSDTTGRYGGVFRIFHFDKIIFTHCRFENNYAYHWGGAMFMKYSNIEIRECIFLFNNCGQAGIPYGYGGALCFVSSEPVVSYNYFERNASTGIGGAVSFEYSDAVVSFNTFYNNQSALGGAFSYLRSNPVNVVSNNLFTENQSLFFGGGIACIRAHAKFVNNTIVNNRSTYGGGFYANDSACPRNYNNLFYGNFAHEGIEVYIWDIYSAPDFYFCNVPGGKEGFSGSGGHEGYHGNYENNQDTLPMFVGSGDQPFSLLKESPLLDAGTEDTASLQIPLKDLAGNQRIYNNRIDMGAFEWNPGEGIPKRIKRIELSAVPNPCSQSTAIRFTLDSPEKSLIRIIDPEGKLVKDFGIQEFNCGKVSIIWDLKSNSGEILPNGVYLCIITGEYFTGSAKIVVTP